MPDIQEMGDGKDNLGQVGKELAGAAWRAGAESAKTAAVSGAQATANAAGAAVQAGAEMGSAVSEMAAGTAAAGPLGAVLSGIWATRHTLFKALVSCCMGLLFLIVLIVSLPSIVTNGVFGLDGVQPREGATLIGSYGEMSDAVTEIIEEAYELSMERVGEIIREGGYDEALSMEALVNHAQASAGYDVCYILSAYSASLEQRNTSRQDLQNKLKAVQDRVFPVTWEEKEITRPAPTLQPQAAGVSPSPSPPAPQTETVKYVVCTVQPFDHEAITTAFSLDPEAQYGPFPLSTGEAIQKMSLVLKKTLYGSYAGGEAVPLTDAELIAFVNAQQCSPMRKYILTTALSLVGKVPYFWGGKSAAGWNDAWNTPRLVTAGGSPTSGTIRPFGLDCSGFSDWTYRTALGISLEAGTGHQWDNSYPIARSELLPGDLGFLMDDDGLDWNHVLIFAGYGPNGQRMWVHSTGGEGVVLNTPSYEAGLATRRPSQVDFDALPPAQ